MNETVPFQHPWSVNCWCGIVGDHVIGTYFFEGRLTRQVYANLLQNVLPVWMEDVPLQFRMNIWMLHDGAPPHYALCLRQVMNESFDENWIVRGGPVAWPPRSSDLTSSDYYYYHVPKLHHKCWLKLDGLFISELTSAYKSRVITSNIFCR